MTPKHQVQWPIYVWRERKPGETVERDERDYVVVRSAKHALRELGLGLKSGEPLPRELATWAASALEAFENQDKPTTLEQAFGLTATAGSPGTAEAHERLARKIHALREKKKSWSEIWKKFEKSGKNLRTLQRIDKKYRLSLVGEELERRISSEDAVRNALDARVDRAQRARRQKQRMGLNKKRGTLPRRAPKKA